jgi:hypothetical protein
MAMNFKVLKIRALALRLLVSGSLTLLKAIVDPKFILFKLVTLIDMYKLEVLKVKKIFNS